MTACIGEPISWLRLERFALGAPDPAIASHVAACPACRQCLDQIRGDAVALPALEVPGRAARTARRRWWLAPGLAAAAAAAVLIAVLWPPAPEPGPGEGRAAVAIKGVGDVVLELVRERRGAIALGAHDYAPGDRWKVVISCPPGAAAQIEVSVADGLTVDHPLATARLACGNRVVVPGAFTVTGERANRVCARIRAADPPAPDPDDGAGTACATLVPARR